MDNKEKIDVILWFVLLIFIAVCAVILMLAVDAQNEMEAQAAGLLPAYLPIIIRDGGNINDPSPTPTWYAPEGLCHAEHCVEKSDGN